MSEPDNQQNSNHTTLFGLTTGDLAKLGMNVVLIIFMWFLWQAYQAKDLQYYTLLERISDNSQRVEVLSDQIADVQRRLDAMMNPRGT